MTFLDFLSTSLHYPARRRVLLERIRRVLSSCRRREECVIRLFKILLDFIEKNPEENARIAASIADSLPAEYGASVAGLIEALRAQGAYPGYASLADRALYDSGVIRILSGDVGCSNLEDAVYVAKESKDFVAIALTLAVLERAGEMRSCERDLARSLLSLIRILYERGKGDLLASILNKYSVRIYVRKSGDEIKGAKITIGNDISVDLTDVVSLVYSDLNAIVALGETGG